VGWVNCINSYHSRRDCLYLYLQERQKKKTRNQDQEVGYGDSEGMAGEPHSPARSLASKAGRPGWEKQRKWIVVHDTDVQKS
jgi:hypothetical protein